MRLLFVVHRPERIGGAARSAGRIVGGLIALGHDVRLFSPVPPESEVSLRRRLQDVVSDSALQASSRRTFEEIQSYQPDLVVGFYGSQGGFSAVTAALLAGVPAVTSLRGNDVNSDFFSPIHQHQVSFAIQKAQAVTTVSRDMQHRVARWFGVDATFIANAVDQSEFQPDPDGAARLRREWDLGDRPIIGLFGEFKPARGLSILPGLIEAVADRATIALVGKVRSESLRDVPDGVRHIPYVSDRQTLCAAYTLCDLVLQPSIDDGMPNAVLEAMACERVVVASPVGGLRDLIRHGQNGFFCERDEWPNTVRDLLAAPPSVGAEARRGLPTPHQEALAFTRVFEGVMAQR
jgi:glycosyltransferase involved in cell wall biosynthesis